MFSFYVMLTVQLSIFILVINKHDAQNLFYNKFISCLHMFRAKCAHRQEVLSQPVQGTATYMYDDTRGCIIQF